MQTFINAAPRSTGQLRSATRFVEADKPTAINEEDDGDGLDTHCENITTYAMTWNPQERRNRGRPRNIYQDIKNAGLT